MKNTRFSPSLNGSLHLGHLYMAWVNQSYARQCHGEFVLRFDDLAPRMAGDDCTRMAEWATEAEAILREADVLPDRTTYLSTYLDPCSAQPESVPSRNRWLRPVEFEGHDNLSNSPRLVETRVRADIAEHIGTVIRGEELLPELQLYEFLNLQLGGPPRELVYLPRLRVRTKGKVTTISKTYGNLQLRDLFRQAWPQQWLDRIKQTILQDPDAPFSWKNLNPDPVIEVE